MNYLFISGLKLLLDKLIYCKLHKVRKNLPIYFVITFKSAYLATSNQQICWYSWKLWG